MSERVRNMYYVDGSAARKMNVVPQRESEPRVREPQRKKTTHAVPKSFDKALAFNMGYTMFVVAAVFIIVCACGYMLFMEAKVSDQQTHINEMEAQLENIKSDNNAMSVSLENMYTIDDIYNIATNELGMVYAKKGQIIYYDSANEDYVKQYQDVPEAE